MASPEANRTKGRRKSLQKIWSSKEWAEKKAEFLSKHIYCEMCGGIATVPHHPTMVSYKAHYTDLELSQCVAYCNRCHFAVHKGLKLCAECGDHYHPWDAPTCRFCFDKAHPEIVKAREEYVEKKEKEAKERKDAQKAKERAAKKRHPCRFHRIGGACGKSLLGTRCVHSPTKAEMKCADFEAKK